MYLFFCLHLELQHSNELGYGLDSKNPYTGGIRRGFFGVKNHKCQYTEKRPIFRATNYQPVCSLNVL